MGRSSRFRPASGFTLVELLLVLMLIGVTAVLAVPKFETFAGLGGEERAIRIISGAVSRAQDLALLENRAQKIVIDLDARTLSLGGGDKAIDLPDVSLAIERAGGRGFQEEGTVSIAVDSYGDAEVFRLRVGASRLLTLNPITGELI